MASITSTPSKYSAEGISYSPQNECEASASAPFFTHLLLELTSLEEISFPTASSRVKFTSLDVSERYLAVGSSSGTVYLFSRYASKHVQRLSSVPVQIISTNEGPVFKLAISPNEKYLAVASRKGPLTIFHLSPIGSSPSAVVTCPCHSITDHVNFVTALRWNPDNRRLYAGDLKGCVSCTCVEGRNFFRSPSEIILETDSEVVDIDIFESSLLISTLTRCCLYDLGSLDCVQIGKKLRYGHFGAMFCSESPGSSYFCDSSKGGAERAQDRLCLVFAARPNGRLWEANKQGVVYRTHQYRDLVDVFRFPIVSYRRNFLSEAMDHESVLSFGLVRRLECEKKQFLLLRGETTFYVVDPLNGKLVLVCDVEEAFDEYAVCGSDVFVLSTDIGALRKFALFSVRKAVEKLCYRGCYTQAANVIFKLQPQVKSINSMPWNDTLIAELINKINESSALFPNEETRCEFASVLIRLFDLAKARLLRNEEVDVEPVSKGLGFRALKDADVRRLNSGIFQVVQGVENSGYEDDFTFRTPSPLRVRSKSTPNMRRPLTVSEKDGRKRRSFPLRQAGLGGEEVGLSELCNDENTERKKLIKKAIEILDKTHLAKVRSLVGSTESLRTLLGCGNQSLSFDSPVTLDVVPRELAVAKKFLELLSNEGRGNKRLLVNDNFLQSNRVLRLSNFGVAAFGSLKDRENLVHKAVLDDVNAEVTVERLRSIKRNVKGARIAKVVKPFGKGVSNQTDELENCGIDNDDSAEDSLKPLPISEAATCTIPVATTITEYKIVTAATKPDSAATSESSSSEKSVKLTTIGIADENLNNASPRVADLSQAKDATCLVENNFVVGQELRIDWVVDESNKQALQEQLNEGSANNQVEHICTADAPSDLKLSGTPETDVASSQVTVSATESSSDMCWIDHCNDCGLHDSWRKVMVFGAVMEQLDVVLDQYEDGGVPSNLSQWEEFFDYYVEFRSQQKACTKSLCDDCAKYFDFERGLTDKLKTMQESFVRKQRQTDEPKRDEQFIRQVSLSFSPNDVYELFFNNCQLKAGSIKNALAETGCDETLKGYNKEDLAVEENENVEKMRWFMQNFGRLLTLSLSQILNCMRLCEGMKAVFTILHSHKQLVSRMTQKDWQWLVVLKAYDAEKKKTVLPKQLVSSTLAELNIESIVDVGSESVNTSTESNLKPGFRSFTASTTFSADGCCPFCTLPLKTIVSDSDCFVSAFACGHAYHKVCLREANIAQCVRCELERRRAKKQVNSGSMRNTRFHESSSVPLPFSSNARYNQVRPSSFNVSGPRKFSNARDK